MKINYVFMRSKSGWLNDDQSPLVSGFVHIEDGKSGEGLYWEILFNDGARDYVHFKQVDGEELSFLVE
jgi:hypothetical protein